MAGARQWQPSPINQRSGKAGRQAGWAAALLTHYPQLQEPCRAPAVGSRSDTVFGVIEHVDDISLISLINTKAVYTVSVKAAVCGPDSAGRVEILTSFVFQPISCSTCKTVRP